MFKGKTALITDMSSTDGGAADQAVRHRRASRRADAFLGGEAAASITDAVLLIAGGLTAH